MANPNQIMAAGRRALTRLNPLLAFAQQAQNDPQSHSLLTAKVEMAKQIHDAFLETYNSDLATLEETDDSVMSTLDDLMVQIDDMFCTIHSVLYNMISINMAQSQVSQPLQGKPSKVKLPIIKLPMFSGDYREYTTFIELFNSLIHTNANLSETEKLHYLTLSLKDEAYKIVKTLPVTAANYHVALSMLNERFNDKRKIATEHLTTIFNLKPVSIKSAASLRSLVNAFLENLNALKALNINNEELVDFVWSTLLHEKLDPETRERFELSLDDNTNIPSLTNMLDFVSAQCRGLEAAVLTKTSNTATLSKPNPKSSPSVQFRKHNSSKVVTQNSFGTTTLLAKVTKPTMFNCPFCQQHHSIFKCDVFLTKSPTERVPLVKQTNLCFNCLSNTHVINKCSSKVNCAICKKRHHTFLHIDNPAHSPNVSSENTLSEGNNSQNVASALPPTPTASFMATNPAPIGVLLATALLQIRNERGKYITCRAVLDSGSQASFISQNCLAKLGLPKSPLTTPITGLNQMSSTSNSGRTVCQIKPCNAHDPSFSLDTIVIPSICGLMPTQAMPVKNWKHLKGLRLADPKFHIPREVDLLLGADAHAMLLKDGMKKGPPNEPMAINTIFGWVLLGPVNFPAVADINSFFTSLENSLDDTLKKFWEVEQIPSRTVQSNEAIQCESYYVESHTRDNTGRYTVALPFKTPDPCLGDSKKIALRRFLLLEQRLIKNSPLYEEYSKFMHDYLDSGHMSLLTQQQVNEEPHYYIPHHCILKPESSSTKLRVVFDASATTIEGNSLNKSLHIGPKLQQDIASILLAFRSHPVALTADIKQMYRQILVKPEHRRYQRILWRFSPDAPLSEFQLNTVTYGVSSSPFLALRTIQQLAIDHASEFPLAAELLQKDVYVDDIVTGADSRQACLEVQTQLISLLLKGGFELRKWSSNDPRLLDSVPAAHQQPLSFDVDDPASIKILGLQWAPTLDVFSYKVQPMERPCTKRHLLSELARIFDPLGFLAPLTLVSKHLIQQLWSLGLDWDQSPPQTIINRWDTYKSQLPDLSSLQIPRNVISNDVVSYELHGFCDASEIGYAAVIYFRLTATTNQISSRLICAKSKVTPLKRLSIPRLELCAAVLLANLIKFVVDTYRNISFTSINAWSDSTVTLAWIKSSPHRWKTFVSNRVSHIQEQVPSHLWSHVRGVDNPADCASRGLLPADLKSHPLWWAGPPWFLHDRNQWPEQPVIVASNDEVAEERKIVLMTEVPQHWMMELLQNHSSLRKVQRLIAYWVRYCNNLRNAQPKIRGHLTKSELEKALLLVIKRVQRTMFLQEINQIKNGESCRKPIQQLSPFLDEEGMIRVGGRLQNAHISFEAQHPLLLPRNHHLTQMIISTFHRENQHAGHQTVLYLLRQQFWILASRRAIRQCIAQCNICHRANPKSMVPQMGNLPIARVSQLKPFSHTGVDFAGPISFTPIRRRGARSHKAYIAIFVCLPTKAIHLELVSDLTSEAFLAALRRFIARRGRCSDLYSDCGTNFIGANKLLTTYAQQAANGLQIKWHFNPPSAPHFGGLWEAGVKSVKTHLVRVIGSQILTFEEYYTVLTQIEALLNSRPLTPQSSSPDDITALTPGHFLTLEPLTAPVDQEVTHLQLNRLSRWQLIQRIQQDFWKRWHREYLNNLQQRSKWSQATSNPKIGTLVLLKDERLPSLQWRLGRIVRVYPGSDGVVRVAQIKTASGILNRPLSKLCPLPAQ